MAARAHRPQLTFALFLGASVLLHVALAGLWPDTPAATATVIDSLLAVRLSPQAEARPAAAQTVPAPVLVPPSPRMRRERPPAPHTVAQREPDAASVQPPAASTDVQLHEADATDAPPAVDTIRAQEHDRITAHVKVELARHFHYPALAVRRNWQGIVLLGFRIGINGDIEAVHIARSSGHALLDRAALGALGKVSRVALDHGPLRAALDLQLPVIYRLEEG